MFIFLYTVFRNSSISDEHVFCVSLHFTIGQKKKAALTIEIGLQLFCAFEVILLWNKS